MPFNLLTVRSADSTADDFLYPALAAVDDAPFLISTDGADGPQITHLRASKVVISEVMDGRRKEVSSLGDVKLDVLITDSRLALYCSKYDKGGGWIGSPGAMLVSNAVSKTRAAIRRHNKLLVGQARYGWIASVGGTSKTSWLTDEQLRVIVTEKTPTGERVVILELTFPKGDDGRAIALEVASRAARYRLSSGETLQEAEREQMVSVANAQRLQPEPKSYATHTLAAPYFVGAKMPIPPTQLSPELVQPPSQPGPVGARSGPPLATPVPPIRSIKLGVDLKTSKKTGEVGAIVKNVAPGSLAMSIGLEPGDVITWVGGRKVQTDDELVQALRSIPDGPTARIGWMRNGQPNSFDVQMT